MFAITRGAGIPAPFFFAAQVENICFHLFRTTVLPNMVAEEFEVTVITGGNSRQQSRDSRHMLRLSCGGTLHSLIVSFIPPNREVRE